MSSFSLRSASDPSISEIADLITRGFEGYFVPININSSNLLTMIRRDGVDLIESRVLLKDEQPIGVALIARRGWTSRLAAMGIISNARNGGAGTWIMGQLIEEARARSEKEMVLEVIEQNIAGVKLYQKTGFQSVRRLVGYQLENPQVEAKDMLEEIDIRELARLIASDGLKDLPWQVSGESIAHHTPPSRAFRLQNAYCLISNPEVKDVVIWSVLERADSSEAGSGPDLMRAVFSRFPNKSWHAPAIHPEEMGRMFEEAGMKREEISQLQMVLKL